MFIKVMFILIIRKCYLKKEFIMKKSYIIILTGLVLALTLRVSAQQDPMFAHYMFNQLVLNPAYAGSTDYASFSATTRHQWVGLEGAPQTQTFSAHTPLKNQMGVGLTLGRDVAGPMSTFMFEVNCSYKLKISDKSDLLFGLMAGFNNSNVQLTDLENVDPDDVSFHSNINAFKPVFGTGIYFSNPKGFASLSIPDLVETDYTTQAVSWQHKRHYYLSGGFVASLGEEVKIRPSLMTRYVVGTPISVELTTSLIFKEKFWFGLIYRYNDAVGALAALQINPQLRIAYSYDYSTSMLRGYQGGSHELSITYDMNFGAKSHTSPRYF